MHWIADCPSDHILAWIFWVFGLKVSVWVCVIEDSFVVYLAFACRRSTAISKLITQHNLVIMLLSICPCSCYVQITHYLNKSQEALWTSCFEFLWELLAVGDNLVVVDCGLYFHIPGEMLFVLKSDAGFLHCKHFNCTHHKCVCF